jgi:hypothetical protein
MYGGGMMEYKRLTGKDIKLDKKQFVGTNYGKGVSYEFNEEALDNIVKVFNRLAELEDKIEQGTLIYPKYPIYSSVYIIDYLDEQENSVPNGNPIVRKCFVLSITQVSKHTSLLYHVQPHDLTEDELDGDKYKYWERALLEKELYATREEAEKRLKELQNG